jgi:hypothetical protein
MDGDCPTRLSFATSSSLRQTAPSITLPSFGVAHRHIFILQCRIPESTADPPVSDDFSFTKVSGAAAEPDFLSPNTDFDWESEFP